MMMAKEYTLLAYEDTAHQALRAFDAPALAQLLCQGRVHPTFTLLPRGSAEGRRGNSLLSYAVEYEWADGIALCMRHGGAPSTIEPFPVRGVESPLHGALTEPPHRGLDAAYALVLLGHLPVDTRLATLKPKEEEQVMAEEAAATDRLQLTALMYAAAQNHPYAVRYLVECRDASKEASDLLGRNALWHAMTRVERGFERRVRRGLPYGDRDANDAPLPLDAIVAELLLLDGRYYYIVPTHPKFPHVMHAVQRELARIHARRC